MLLVNPEFKGGNGNRERIRTANLRDLRPALYQLSYPDILVGIGKYPSPTHLGSRLRPCPTRGTR